MFQVRQALGTAIYKALDYGLSESEEPHLSPELEELIEFLTDHPLPTDDDEGIDIERDSDQDIEDSQNREHSEFQYIIDVSAVHATHL
jgi:spire-like protein